MKFDIYNNNKEFFKRNYFKPKLSYSKESFITNDRNSRSLSKRNKFSKKETYKNIVQKGKKFGSQDTEKIDIFESLNKRKASQVCILFLFYLFN